MSKDGKCAFVDCTMSIDWSEHDKPPPGWAQGVFRRYGKTRASEVVLLMCPRHSVEVCERQMSLLPRSRAGRPEPPREVAPVSDGLHHDDL